MYFNCKRSAILVSLIVFTGFNGMAQSNLINPNAFWQGEIKLTDNSIKKGYIRVPDSGDDNSIVYRAGEKGEKESIKSDLIESFTVVSDKGNRYSFERLATRFNIKKEKVSDKKYFLLEYKKGTHATFYFTSNGYYTNAKDGTLDIVNTYLSGKDLPTFTYLIRKKNQEFADVFSQTSPSKTMFGLNKMLKVRASYLIADDPSLLKRIEADEFKHTQIPEVIDIYLKDMEGK